MSAGSKLLSRAGAVAWRRRMAASGRKVVFTNGCFDILHAGHVRILRGARACGDALVVGLNSDASVRRLKGPARPLNSQRDRAEVLSALEAVDRVVVFGEQTPRELLRALRPDVLVKGADYRPDEVAGREYAGKVVLLPLLKGRSTTGIIRRAGGGKSVGGAENLQNRKIIS